MCGNACRVFGEAWHKVKGMKGPMWGGLALLALIGVGGLSILALILIFAQIHYMPGLIALMHADPFFFLQGIQAIPLGLIGLILLYHLGQALFEMLVLLPMRMGLFLVPLRHDVGKPTSALYVLKFFTWQYIWRFAVLEGLVVIMLGVPLGIGLALVCYAKMMVPVLGIKIFCYVIATLLYGVVLYLLVAYVFAHLLIIDRKMEPWQAMEMSRKAISKRWFCVFGALIWILIVTIVGTALLLVGLIWAIPYTQNVLVILYRDMMGIEGRDPVSVSESNHGGA